jgi:hypothetical protein
MVARLQRVHHCPIGGAWRLEMGVRRCRIGDDDDGGASPKSPSSHWGTDTRQHHRHPPCRRRRVSGYTCPCGKWSVCMVCATRADPEDDDK